MEQYILPRKEKLIIEAEVLFQFLEEELHFFAKEKGVRAAIYIYKDKIQQIAPLKRNEPFIPPKGCQVIRIPSEWVLIPGFVDCHVHLALDGIKGFRGLRAPVPKEVLIKRLQLAAGNGLVALRDGGDSLGTSLFKIADTLAREGTQADVSSPRLISCGKALYRRGCYGKSLGNEGITGLNDAEEIINRLRDEGASQLKVVLTGLVSFQKKGEVGKVQFSAREMRSIVQKAEKKGLPVMVHASSDSAVRLAVEAGAHSIEHGFFLKEKTLELMAAKGVSWIPTVTPVGAAQLMFKEQQKSPEKELLQEIIEEHLSNIKKASQLGVSIGIGTDTGAPGVTWEDGYRQEVLYFFQAELSPQEVLRAAISNGTNILEMNKEIGTISRGKKPRLICLHKYFFSSPQAYKGPTAIFKTS